MNSHIQAENLPFFKLSDSQDLILFLIKKELQGTKFVQELDRVGFDPSVFCPDLGVVILSLVGFENRSDELWNWYSEVVDVFAEKVDLWNRDTVQELALDVYLELRAKLKSERGSR
ncbi:MAG: hypothetical protein ABJG47_18585 [Ekhidna sp.]